MTLLEAPITNEDSVNEKSALGRAQRIIDAFTPDEPVLTLGVLARRAGLPKSTAHRFVEQMLGLGWLERRHEGYRVGVRLYEMGELCERRNNLRRAASSHLTTLARVSGRSAYLSVLDEASAIFLDRVAAPGTIASRAGRRIRFPVLTTAFGKAILAFEGADEIQRQVAHAWNDPLGRSGATVDALHEELALIGMRGYALGRSRRSDAWFMAVPLRNCGRAIASIAVTAPLDNLDDRVVDLMKQSAQAIWNDLFPPRGAR